MHKLLFALYDTKGYMPVLAEYLSKKSFLLECRLFTKVESLTDFLMEHKVDVLLLGQEVNINTLHGAGQIKNIVIMSEEEGTAAVQDFPAIFKYQSAEVIMDQIFQIAESRKAFFHLAQTDEKRSMFYALFRPYGNFLEVQDLMEDSEWSEKKCLILNMELLNGLEGEEVLREKGKGHRRGMSELIFYLKQRKGKVALKLETLVRQWRGMDYLYPVEDYRDLYSLNREDIDSLFAILSEETEYEAVVFDISFLSDASLYLLYCCDNIYIPEADGEWERNQKNSLIQLFCREGLEEVLEHVEYISASA